MLSRTLFIIALHARMAMAYPSGSGSGSGSGDDYYGSAAPGQCREYCELRNWPECGISVDNQHKRRDIASDRQRRTKCSCDNYECYTLHGEALSRVCQERGETTGACSTVRVPCLSNFLIRPCHSMLLPQVASSLGSTSNQYLIDPRTERLVFSPRIGSV